MEDFQIDALNKQYTVTVDKTIPFVKDNFDTVYFNLIELGILIKKVFKVKPTLSLFIDYELPDWKTLFIGIPLSKNAYYSEKTEKKMLHDIFEKWLVPKTKSFKTLITINIDLV